MAQACKLVVSAQRASTAAGRFGRERRGWTGPPGV